MSGSVCETVKSVLPYLHSPQVRMADLVTEYPSRVSLLCFFPFGK
jgi:hypothetical protein